MDLARNLKIESVSRLPRDHVIGARSVAAHPHAANDFSFCIVQRQPPAEDDRATNRFPYEGIVRLAKVFRLAGEDGIRIWRR